MTQLFGSKAPKADPAIEQARIAEQKRLDEERSRQDQIKADEEAARKAGLRGSRSLLSGSELGYTSTLG